MATRTATILDAGQGERRWFAGGGIHTWKATCDATAGALLIFEDHLEGGKATPLHVHPEADETFYMLEGEIRLVVAEDETRLAAGAIAVVPRGVPHAFLVISTEARMLCIQTPGSGEAFYRQASDPTEQTEPRGPVDLARVGEAAHQTGAIVILGPPPFAPTATESAPKSERPRAAGRR